MTLTKADLIETIQSKNDLTLKQSTNLVETLMEIMKDIHKKLSVPTSWHGIWTRKV